MVAWGSLLGQVLLLAERGGRHDDAASLLGSMILGALFVGYVSAGVIRARPVRLFLAWIVLVLSVVGAVAELVLVAELVPVDDSGEPTLDVLLLGAAVAALGGLLAFRRSDWYAWQRTRPSAREGARIGRLVAIGVLVGVLTGLTGPDNGDVSVHSGAVDH